MIELSERLAIKYMVQSDNDFANLIETQVICANNQLKIEKSPEYLVADVHSNRGYFVVEEELVTVPKYTSKNYLTGSNFNIGDNVSSVHTLNAFNSSARNKSIEPYSNYGTESLYQHKIERDQSTDLVYGINRR